MDTTIVVAIIAGIFGIFTPLITYFVIHFHKTKWKKMTKSRKDALVGVWKGKLNQPYEGEIVEAFVEATISISGNEIIGRGSSRVHFPGVLEEKNFQFEAKGGFVHDRFLQMEYRGTNSNIIHFGAILLELDSSARTLTGEFLGYGSLSEKITSSKASFNKIDI